MAPPPYATLPLPYYKVEMWFQIDPQLDMLPSNVKQGNLKSHFHIYV